MTTYEYDPQGRLSSVSYSDGTPGVTHQYYRSGHLKQTVDAAGTHEFSLPPVGAGVGERILKNFQWL